MNLRSQSDVHFRKEGNITKKAEITPLENFDICSTCIYM